MPKCIALLLQTVEIRSPEPMSFCRRQSSSPMTFQCKCYRWERIRQLSNWRRRKYNFEWIVTAKRCKNKLTWQRPTLRLLSIEMLPKLSEQGTNFKQSIWLMILLSAALHWYRTQPGEGYANADVFDDSKMVTENSLLCFSWCCLITAFLVMSNSIATILPLGIPHQTSRHLLGEFEGYIWNLFVRKWEWSLITDRASRAIVVMLHSTLVPLTPISAITKLSWTFTHLIG